MKTALVIFNGIRFPYYLVDHVIAWAKKNNSGIHALFIKAEDEVKEGYVFPSDLDAAENLTDAEDTGKVNIGVIQSQMKLLEDMGKTENVVINTELVTAPSLNDILVTAKNSGALFIDSDFDQPGILSVTDFTLKDLIKKSPAPVEVIKSND